MGKPPLVGPSRACARIVRWPNVAALVVRPRDGIYPQRHENIRERLMDSLPGTTTIRLAVPRFVVVVPCLLAAGLALLAAAAAAPWHVGEFADAGWFSFAILTGRSWDLVWSDFVPRLTVYLLTVRPAELLLAWTGNAPLALATYATLFGAMPAVGFLLCWAVVPRDARGDLLWPALSFVTVGFTVYGFPTEIWVTQSLFWPLLLHARHRSPGIGGTLLLGLLVLLFAFSHESMVLCLPAVALAIVARAHETGRRADLLMPLALLAACVMMWAGVRHGWPPRHSTMAWVLKNNSYYLLHSLLAPLQPFSNPIHEKLALLFLPTCVVVLVAPWRSRYATGLAIGLLAAAILLAGRNMGLATWQRYDGRSLIAAVLPVLGLAAAILRIRIAPAVTPPYRATLIVACAALAGVALIQVSETARFLVALRQFREALATLVMTPVDTTTMPDEARLPPAPGGRPWNTVAPGGVWSVGWDWTLPYQSFLVAPNMAPNALLTSTSDHIHPVECGDMAIIESAPALRGRSALALLRQFNCER